MIGGPRITESRDTECKRDTHLPELNYWAPEVFEQQLTECGQSKPPHANHEGLIERDTRQLTIHISIAPGNANTKKKC